MPAMSQPRAYWRLCSTCRKELPFQEIYWVCSVSTCNRKKMPLTFCSVACWDAHLPTMRHRDAWTEERRAPTRAKWEAEVAAGSDSRMPRRPVMERTATAPPPGRRVMERAVSAAPAPSPPAATMEPRDGPEIRLSDDDLPREVLIVTSRLKQYIKARSGMKTSESVLMVLSDMVRERCDAAIRQAARAERKTVMDRDF